MTNCKVFISKCLVTNKGQLQRFQIALPSDAESIIGVETSYRFKLIPNIESLNFIYNYLYAKDDVPVPFFLWDTFIDFPNLVMGRLTLQSMDTNNIAYSTEILFEDIKYGSFDPAWSFFDGFYRYTHKLKSDVDEVLIDGKTTVLEASYKDELGLTADEDYTYQVNIYLWYKPKQPTL